MFAFVFNSFCAVANAVCATIPENDLRYVNLVVAVICGVSAGVALRDIS